MQVLFIDINRLGAIGLPAANQKFEDEPALSNKASG